MPFSSMPFATILLLCRRWQEICVEEPNNPYNQFMRTTLCRMVRNHVLSEMAKP